MTLVAPTAEKFREYLGINGLDSDADAALTVAIALVDDFLLSAYRDIPQVIYTNEIFRTAHAVYKQSETVSGSQQLIQPDASVLTTRFARDPMSGSYPVLRRYVLPV